MIIKIQPAIWRYYINHYPLTSICFRRLKFEPFVYAEDQRLSTLPVFAAATKECCHFPRRAIMNCIHNSAKPLSFVSPFVFRSLRAFVRGAFFLLFTRSFTTQIVFARIIKLQQQLPRAVAKHIMLM
jgi:hypothetical protein